VVAGPPAVVELEVWTLVVSRVVLEDWMAVVTEAAADDWEEIPCVSTEAEVVEDAGTEGPKEGNLVAEPRRPQPASADVTIARVSRDAKATLNLSKTQTKVTKTEFSS
jgi:hypothetical protein